MVMPHLRSRRIWTSWKQADVLYRRYQNGETLKEVARHYGLSRERIRIVEATALGYLRAAYARRELPAAAYKRFPRLGRAVFGEWPTDRP